MRMEGSNRGGVCVCRHAYVHDGEGGKTLNWKGQRMRKKLIGGSETETEGERWGTEARGMR